MAGELQVTHSTGATVYALVIDATGQVWDATDGAFEAYATAELTNGDLDVSLAELGTASQIYTGTFPATIAAGEYWAIYRAQAGGAPAEADTVISSERIQWNGSVRLSRAAWAHMDQDPIAKARTWVARADQTLCREIVETTTNTTAYYAMDFSAVLSPHTSVLTADSAVDQSGNSLTTSDVSVSQDKMHLHFKVTASDLTASTDYTIRCTVTTTDGITVAKEGLLRCTD